MTKLDHWQTCWTWQRAVRFYLRTGFWLRSWKRDLSFTRYPRAPAPLVDIGDTDATVAVVVAGRTTVLARARQDGRRLLYHDEEPDLPDTFRELSYDARREAPFPDIVRDHIVLVGPPLREVIDGKDRPRKAG